MERMQSIPKELISQTIVVDHKTPMSKVSSYFKKYPAIIINKDKEYFGIVDTRTVYRMKQDMKMSPNEKIGNFSVKVPKITNSTSIDDLIYYFYRSGVKALPFSNGSKIIGVLERKTLMKMLLSLNILEDMKVSEAMTTPVLAIDGNANLSQAKATMREKKVNRLIVLANNKFAGLITNYDLTRYYSKESERLPEMKTEIYKPSNIGVSSIMEKNVRSIEYNRSLSDAVRDMIENSVSSLAVLRKGNPVGMLTVTDVFESVLARKRVEERRVFLSGFDAQTYQYEDYAREELRLFVDGINRLGGIDVDYITFKVKRSKTKLYEMQCRLSLGRHGIITVHTSKYLFEDALKDLLTKLKRQVIREKESMITSKRSKQREEEE